MNVNIQIELVVSPGAREHDEAYSIAEELTDNAESIDVVKLKETNTIEVSFSIKEARQRDIVDLISAKFRKGVINYGASSISFSKSLKQEKNTKKRITPKQGQYLSFILHYQKLNGVSPAETDFQHYFKVSAPSVHNMIVTLEKKGYIKRTPIMARSIELLVLKEEIPSLE